jgi:PadR family transcriptional regulator, regulatory protein PadR
MRHGASGRRGPRSRSLLRPGHWNVRVRVERFLEAAILLLLYERPAHGYELIEQLPLLMPGERIDMGNLYRILRALEEEGIVASEWREDLPGPTKRVYELTDTGRRLLDTWARAFRKAQLHIGAFVERYEQREEVNDASSPSG